MKETLLAQMLRKESDVSVDGMFLKSTTQYWTGPVVYNDAIPQTVVSETSWGTLSFSFADEGYSATNFCSYFTDFCATADSPQDCDATYTGRGYYVDLPGDELTPLQTSYDGLTDTSYFFMPSESFNPAGLAYTSATYRIDGEAPVTLSPGQSNAVPGSFGFEAALQTETPSFQTVNYYFDGRQYPIQTQGYPIQRSSPPVFGTNAVTDDGWMFNFDPTASGVPVGTCITNPIIVAQVGRPVTLQSWRRVVAVNSEGGTITNQTYWIDEDFNAAYLCNPITGDVTRILETNYNGKFKIDTNDAQTGILSPSLDFTNVPSYTSYFGQRGATFTPTQPGKVIVTTAPDSNGFYGEVTIYVIDMQVDANHDGTMDNRDLTSPNNPMQFWVNNDIDRWHSIDYGTDDEQDDLLINDLSLAQWQEVPDCQYQVNGQYAIPSTRDLEDYARLWIPGLTNLMHVLPSGYGINLQWRNATGAGIRIFGAADADGGTNYLFNGTIASNQVDPGWYPCFGYATSNQPLVANYTAWQNLNGYLPSDHFIFCGTSAGSDELVLQVTNQYGGVAGEASVFLNLQDIKRMYERWSIGEYPQTPSNIATNCGDDVASFSYPYDPTVDATTPYILHVHGSNMKTWEKDRYAETMYKRLYWQGYQGRFGSFRWPTAFDFNPVLDSTAGFFGGIELTAWFSAPGLKNMLTRLNTLYPNQVQLSAHSMGNIVVGETLRQSTTTLIQTFTAFQGNTPAHTYDPNAPTLSLGSSDKGEPNVYAHYWTATNDQYFAGVGGAARYVNFFNTNDFVLNYWLSYQQNKPVGFFGYNSTSGYYLAHYSGDPSPVILAFPTNTYEIFAFCQQAKCNCIGEQAGLGEAFSGNQVDLHAAPYAFGDDHKGHSAEFRSDNISRAIFWNQVLVQMRLKLQQ